MRIDKYLSLTGSISRRTAKRLLEEGRVTAGGKVCSLNTEIDPEDEVLVDGLVPERKKRDYYYAFHKPPGIVCTSAQDVEGNIIDYLNLPQRVFPVGRLDKASQGLILLTNDGDIVNRILKSEYGHEKEYLVRTDREFDDFFLQELSIGVDILNTRTKPCKVFREGEREFRIILTQGLNRQIRRMCKEFGYNVISLERIRIMHINLGNLGEGSIRELTKDEIDMLKKK
ncbi:pseudouridine synthase [Bacillus lacus]|uniref:Pseudouridine synthase n=1 Tax=Metabacillus lacus TaxID=1983721 RepID=A0A7X2IWN8_9BACI|nr:pseudouridine synthase [Metabacillus lacus]MRX71193.1 pseudouridine synthase [Metabacillus lacus]